jgi:hypothetical protein
VARAAYVTLFCEWCGSEIPEERRKYRAKTCSQRCTDRKIIDFLPETLPAEAMDKLKQAHRLIVDARQSGFDRIEQVSKEAKEGG